MTDPAFYLPPRRFKVGDRYVVSDVKFRVLQGHKGPKDLRLEWLGSDGYWHPVEMALGCFLADFFHENEETLYPKGTRSPQGTTYLGGEKYFRAMREARDHGWRHAANQIDWERQLKRNRPSLFDEDESA